MDKETNPALRVWKIAMSKIVLAMLQQAEAMLFRIGDTDTATDIHYIASGLAKNILEAESEDASTNGS
jgi:hypothetical protein